MQLIYIDVLLLLNVIVDFFIFKITLLLMNKEAGIKKCIIASFVAGFLFCMPLFFKPLQQLPYFIYYLYVPVLSILYLFKPKTCIHYLKIYGVCLGVSAIIGGLIFNIYFLLRQYIQTITISVTFIILVACGIYLVVSYFILEIRKQKIRYGFEYQLTISLNKKHVSIKSFLDTGNQLYTLDKKPILMARYESVKHILSEKQNELIDKSRYVDVLRLVLEKQYRDLGMELVPFCSVGCEGDVLIGFKVDELIIKRDGFESKIEGAVMGITFKSFFNSDTYQALLHPEMIEV